MNIAITGGTGFIGRHLLARHVALGDRVRYLWWKTTTRHYQITILIDTSIVYARPVLQINIHLPHEYFL